MGFKIIIYAANCLIPAYKGTTEALQILQKAGEAPEAGEGFSPNDVFKVCGLDELMEFDRAAIVESS